MKNQKLVMIACAIFTLVAVLLIGGKVYTKYLREQIKEELRSSYTPGPYNPGFNPDKMPNKVEMPTQPSQMYPPQQNIGIQPDQWNQTWEYERR